MPIKSSTTLVSEALLVIQAYSFCKENPYDPINKYSNRTDGRRSTTYRGCLPCSARPSVSDTPRSQRWLLASSLQSFRNDVPQPRRRVVRR